MPLSITPFDEIEGFSWGGAIKIERRRSLASAVREGQVCES